MAGPWEDFAPARDEEKKKPPWEDFALPEFSFDDVASGSSSTAARGAPKGAGSPRASYALAGSLDLGTQPLRETPFAGVTSGSSSTAARRAPENAGNAPDAFEAARQAQTKADVTPRSWGRLAGDTGLALMQGAMDFAALPGTLYGLATGDMNNAYSALFRPGQEAAEALKSDKVKAEQAALAAKINAAEGWQEKLAVGLFEGAKNGTVAYDQLVRMVPQILAGGGVGRATEKLLEGAVQIAKAAPTAAAIAGRAQPAAELTATAVGKLGQAGRAVTASPIGKFIPSAATAGAVGTSAGVQGQSVLEDTIKEAEKIPVDMFAANDPKYLPLVDKLEAEGLPRGAAMLEARTQRASEMAQSAGLQAFAWSLLSQALPGGSTIETALLKKAGPGVAATGLGATLKEVAKSAPRTALLETGSEGFEEASGSAAKDLQLRRADPTIDVLGNAAAAGGQGAALGLIGGGLAGAIGRPAAPATLTFSDPAGPTSQAGIRPVEIPTAAVGVDAPAPKAPAPGTQAGDIEAVAPALADEILAAEVARQPTSVPGAAVAAAEDEIVEPAAGEPIQTWSGRRGAGYITPEDAVQARRARQKDSDRKGEQVAWRVLRQGERYVVGAYPTTTPEPIASPEAATQAPGTYRTEAEAHDASVEQGLGETHVVADTGEGWAIMPRVVEQTPAGLEDAQRAVKETLAPAVAAAMPTKDLSKLTAISDKDASLRLGKAGTAFVSAVRQTFSIPVHFVAGLDEGGVYLAGRTYIDASTLAKRPNKLGQLIATTGHEVSHLFDASRDPADQAISKGLRTVVEKYRVAGTLEARRAAESKGRAEPVTAEYAAREIDADLSGGFWTQSDFWGEVVDALGTGGAKKVFARFMQVATRFIENLKGTTFDASAYVTNVEEVRKAFAAGWASRLERGAPDQVKRRAVQPAGPAMSRAQTETPEFKAWFGKSKVTAVTGKPLMMYHGTDAESFNTFRTPTYFTRTRSDAENWGSRTEATYLSLQNPIEIDDYEAFSDLDADAVRAFEREGYDGAIHRTGRGAVQMAVAFRPEQIKSATDNTGAFGVRAPTESEAADAGLTEAEALTAQKAGDIRFARQQDDGGSREFDLGAERGAPDQVKRRAVQPAGPAMSRAQTETPEFKAWFGKSKVTAVTGKPLVVYHGTGASFTRFKTVKEMLDEQGGRAVSPSYYDMATAEPDLFFFTEDPVIAEGYGDTTGKGSKVMPVYLQADRVAVDDGRDGGSRDRAIDEMLEKDLDAASFWDTDSAGRGEHRAWVVRRPNQIKSAISNRGTFDPNDPDIRFARQQGDGGPREFELGAERGERATAGWASLSKEEVQALETAGNKLGLAAKTIERLKQEARATKRRFPARDGWAQLTVVGIDTKQDPATKQPVPESAEVEFKLIPYGFDVPPGKTRAPPKRDAAWLAQVTDAFDKEIDNIYTRAAAGDTVAARILSHAGWYRNVARALREEYGGFGDLLSDLLGATSPITPVDQNWKNSVDILRRLVRGAFNDELQAFSDYLRKGGKAGEYPAADKIRTITGKLYGINSGSAMLAALDLWRNIEPGQLPKALNFALNLIGQSKMATIDVWAARMLRRVANGLGGRPLPRIPRPAESAVTGRWDAAGKATVGQYGFGAAVMDGVAERQQAKGHDLEAPDLQAIAWFAEKELWTVNDWTTEAGEGGSFEQNLAEAPAELWLGGVSVQQGEAFPAAEAVSAAQEKILSPLRDDPAVIAVRMPETFGLYGGTVERSFDLEWVVERGQYDPSAAMLAIAETARDNRQLDFFVSRALRTDETSPNARPGVEIYFRNKRSLEQAQPVLDAFVAGGQDGFTMVVDPRVQGPDEFIGVRLQYVPEISMRWDEDLRKTLLDPGGIEAVLAEKSEKLHELADQVRTMPGVAHAAARKYDTVVVGHEDYDALIARGTRSGPSPARSQVWFGQPVREGLERASARLQGERGQVGEGRVPDGGVPLPEDAQFSRAEPSVGPPEPPVRPGRSGDAGGRAAQEAVSAWHYSTLPGLEALSGSAYGRGIRGAERVRLSEPGVDPRIKRRVYFYVPRGDGSLPAREAGLGPFRYEADLTGLLETADRAAMARLPSPSGDANAFESAVLDAGYRGYVSRSIGMAVVLNTDVPVRAAGQVDSDRGTAAPGGARPAAPSRPTTRVEGNEFVRRLVNDELSSFIRARPALVKAAPSLRLEYGEARVRAAERDAANEALTEAGSTVQFSRSETLREDLDQQQAFLEERARAAGFQSVDDFVDQDYPAFVRAAAQWRQENPAEVLFSRDIAQPDPELERWARDAWAGRKVTPEEVVLAQNAPHPAMMMAPGPVAIGRSQPWVLKDHVVRHDKRRHEGDGMSPREISRLPAGLRNPRAVVHTTEGEGFAIVPATVFGKPTAVWFKKDTATAPGGRSGIKIVRLASAYPLDDSLRVLLDLAKKNGSRVWLPSEELSRVRGLLGDLKRPSSERPPQATLPRQGGPTEPTPRKPQTRATAVSVLSDEALRKFQAGDKTWVATTEQLDVPANLAELGGIAFSRAQEPFYSALGRQIATMPDKLPAVGWKGAIQSAVNKGHIKKDEVEWSGLNEWLDLQQGKVTREQVQQYLDANGVRVEEVTLGGFDREAAVREFESEFYDRGVGEYRGFTIEDDGEVDSRRGTRFVIRRGIFPRTMRTHHVDEVLQSIDDELEGSGASAKYEKYQLPGGENYREVLLTLPAKTDEGARNTRLSEIADEMNDGKTTPARFAELHAERARLATESLAADDARFKSPHWDQPNVLAHVRLNDRTDADGRRVLFVEELQSDWGQQGKKKGFQVAGKLPEGFSVQKIGRVYRAVNPSGGYLSGEYTSEAAAIAAVNARSDMAVPNAPFVTHTHKWLPLALKRVVKLAVDESYDAVAFVNGEQSADRYDLSKQLDTVLYDPSVTGPGGQIIGRKNGGNTLTHRVASEAELADVVGKEIAERLLAAPKNEYGMHSLSGVDLKVGGEGMKAFYDQLVPSAAKALLKKLGDGQMETMRVSSTKTVSSTTGPRIGRWDEEVMLDQPGFIITPAMREKAAEGLPLFSRAQTSLESKQDDLFPGEFATKRTTVTTSMVVDSKGTRARGGNVNSKGQQIAATKQGLQRFWNWFEGSEAVDDKGRPLVLYHSTNSDFTQFETNRETTNNYGVLGEMTVRRAGIFLTPNLNFSQEYLRDGAGQNVMQVYAALKNPLDLRRGVSERVEAELEAAGISVRYVNNIQNYWEMFDSADDGTNDFVDALKAAGYDGTIFAEGSPGGGSEGGTTYVAFQPEQIKSAIGNRGTFDPNNPDIRFSRNQPPAAGAAPAWTIGDKTGALDSFIYQMQDKTVDLKDLVKAISGTAAAPLSARADARLRETLFHGRVADRSKRFVRDELKPLVTEMQAGGVTMAALGEYLHARHAEERNLAMEAINPNHPDKDWLSGMKTSDARRILANAPPLMARLAARVDAINDATLTLMELAGLETAETIQAIRDAYDYYTPLHRDEAHPDSKVPVGSGFSVTGSPLKRATGSTEAVDHGKILAHIAERRDAVIARAEKTLVGQALYVLALKNPNPDFWTTDTPPTIARIDERREVFSPGLKKMVPNPTYNQVVRVTDPVIHGPGYEHVLIVKVRGEDRMITFNKHNERAARLVASLKNLDVDTLDPVSNFVGHGTRWIASVNTQYNPIFGIKNLIRDIQGAALNLTTTAISGKQLQVLAKLPAAMAAIWRVERDGLQAQGTVEDAYRDLSARGGLTGWRDVYANISEREDALKDVLHSVDHGPLRKGGRAILEGLSRFNASIENSTRLAAYMTALEAGVTPDRGAVIAKEVTVDFNRKGVLSRRLGAWYAFMNASVQGTERTLRTLRGPLGGAIITGGIAMGLAQALLMAGMDDDDREAINEWDLSRNFILPMGDGKFLRVPYALGFHVLPNIGRNLAGMALARQRGDQLDLIGSFGSFLSTALDAFSPVGGGPTASQFLAPTVFDPFVQLGENVNWGGRPIYRERGPWNEEASGASLGRDTTSPAYHFIAQMLNRASGGEEGVRNIDVPAGFSPQPEAIRHLVETVGGGVWRETEKLIEGLMSWGMPGAEPRPMDRWPLTGAFYGDTRAPEAPLSRYYDLARKVEAAEKGQKSLEKSDAPDSDERLQRWLEEHPEASLAKELKASQKRILGLRKQRHEDFLAGVPESSLTATDNEIAQEMRDFNRRYREEVRSAP